MSRHTRAKTVVSQPRRLCTPLVSGRLSHGHDSLGGVVRPGLRPEHPVGHRPQVGPVPPEALGRPGALVH
jgi:hypothetical protein